MGLTVHNYSGDSGFEDYNVVNKATLNFLEVDKNSNKFYTIEIHEAQGKIRLFTEYGRVGASSKKEVRLPSSLAEADREFASIIKSKTKKGYVAIELAQSTTGSQKGKELIDTTLIKVDPTAVIKKQTMLPPLLQAFVKQIYDETGKKLNTLVKGDVSGDGASPLGKLSVNQLDKGRNVLQEIANYINNNTVTIDDVIPLSNEYYRNIPKAFGRKVTKEMIAIDSAEKISEQLDILKFYEDSLRMGSVIYNTNNLDSQYEALKCDLDILDPKSDKFARIVSYVANSESKHHSIHLRVKNVFTVYQKNAPKLSDKIGNVKELFHGTRSANITGILSSYLMLPRQLSGVHITGAMLGSGLYFADQSTKSSQYATSRFGGTSNAYTSAFMFLADVPLGKIHKAPEAHNYTDAPSGCNSVMGVEGWTRAWGGALLHNEFIVYHEDQQALRYIIEFDTVRK